MKQKHKKLHWDLLIRSPFKIAWDNMLIYSVSTNIVFPPFILESNLNPVTNLYFSSGNYGLVVQGILAYLIALHTGIQMCFLAVEKKWVVKVNKQYYLK